MNVAHVFPGFRRFFTLPTIIALVLCLVKNSNAAGGPVIAWGNNNDLQSQVPPGLLNITKVAAGALHSVALKSDSTVVCWGSNSFGQTNIPPNLTNVVAISAGATFSLALKSDGSLVQWGALLTGAPDTTNAIAIAAGWDHALALQTDGTVISWGTQSNTPPWLTNVTAIAAGKGQSMALCADGTVVAWGDNAYGKTNVPPTATNVVAIAAGQDHCLALRRDGSIVPWGGNYAGQTTIPSDITNVVAIAAGSLHNVALKSSGFVAAWGDNTYGQTVVPGLGAIFGFAAGGSHGLAITSTGFPIIEVQPVSQSPIITKNAILQVLASGTPQPTYQWQRDGTNLPGATASSLAFINVQPANAGTYRVIVTNSFGFVVSSNAILTPVGASPIVVIAPLDFVTICGESASFSVRADGTPPFSYQWQFNGTPIAGATRTTLQMTNVNSSQAGGYAAVISNNYGSITSAVANLTVLVVPPYIISPLSVPGKQGLQFNYKISALHTPLSFGAGHLPPGLTINPTTGVISGVPMESGTFGPSITAFNACTNDTEILVITFASSIPIITSPLTATGAEAMPFTYQIAGTDFPTNFGAEDLPLGLTVDSSSGIISGTPVYGGDSYSTIFATNLWGVGSAVLHFTFDYGPITGLSLSDLQTNYSSPYLLDFQFSLRDNDDPTLGNGLVVAPQLLSAVCREDNKTVSPSETAVILTRATSKLFKTELVLDFTESVASLSNGDTNNDGISDAIDAMVAGAQDFVNQQRNGAQVGVYEFHREDLNPQRVVPLTTDKDLLNQSIAGIWTNYVQSFPAASRAWDAMLSAITDLGATNRDEQHYLILVSDGRDESSFATVDDVITAATNANVRIFCIGFGSELDPTDLQLLATATGGRYLDAQTASSITAAFDQIGKEFNSLYLLRWATLKRSTNAFMPSFEINYQGFTAFSPANTIIATMSTNTNSMPPVITTNFTTNFVISPYVPTEHTGSVTVGSLRLAANAQVLADSITLRAFYVPRYIRQMRIHYRANWPCVTSLQSTNAGEILASWSMTETNDGAGGKWLLLSSSNTQSLATSIPFAALGNLVQFTMRDMLYASNAFSFITIDNTIYTNTGNQSFVFESTNEFIVPYPILPHGTPIPWLMVHGFTNNLVAAELSDPDGDGVLTWQEYVANTDPRDPNSMFIITAMDTGLDGRNQVTFISSTNRTYRLDASTDLFNWQVVEDFIDGTGGSITVTDTRYLPGLTQIYYRVAVY
jgi:von Willebrand factor type A domain/Regulator of chromosome condensation (RCC1) repeat/Immunoglobulin domain/Putative Ig domain/Immunoglobulin I-set domain